MATPLETGEASFAREINVTPLVDVMLVLLVIFMVVTPLLREEVPVELPDAEHAAQSGELDQVTLTLLADGTHAVERRTRRRRGARHRAPLALRDARGQVDLPRVRPLACLRRGRRRDGSTAARRASSRSACSRGSRPAGTPRAAADGAGSRTARFIRSLFDPVALPLPPERRHVDAEPGRGLLERRRVREHPLDVPALERLERLRRRLRRATRGRRRREQPVGQVLDADRVAASRARSRARATFTSSRTLPGQS